MIPDKPHYNYESLDKLFTEGLAPEDLGDLLDDIMSELVCLCPDDEHQNEHLGWHYYILRILRDLFWELKQS